MFRTVILVLAVVGVCQAAIELEGGVLVLDDANWDEANEKYPQMLVEFYAPW
jgi:hypothetical protein